MSKPQAFWPLTVADSVNDRIDFWYDSAEHSISVALGTYLSPAGLAEEVMGKLGALAGNHAWNFAPYPCGENLLAMPEHLDDAGVWTPINGAVATSGSYYGPDGGTSRSYFNTLSDNATNDIHGVYQTIGGTENRTDYTLSVTGFAGTHPWLILRLRYMRLGEPTILYGAWASFDLQNEVVGTVTFDAQLGLSVAARLVRHGHEPVGSYPLSRCILSTSAVDGFRLVRADVLVANGDNVISYAGDGTGTVNVWGAKLERGGTFSGYLPAAWPALFGPFTAGRLYLSYAGTSPILWRTQGGGNHARSLAPSLGLYPETDLPVPISGAYSIGKVPRQWVNGWCGDHGVRSDPRERFAATVAQTRALAGNLKTLRFAEVSERLVDLGLLSNYKAKIACERSGVALDAADHTNEAVERLWRDGYARFRWWTNPERDYGDCADYALDLGNGSFDPARNLQKELYSVALSMRRYV